MKSFLDANFLLQTETAKRLYHDFAQQMPIIDYHCHLPVQQIADDINFENLTQIWLYGDHYKWRAMRANGVDEIILPVIKPILKNLKSGWIRSLYLRNPLYHWTHLELKRYFDVHELLKPESAREIYNDCTEKLQTKGYTVKNLLRKMNVQVVCTTDDPVDSLEYHKKIKEDGFEIKVLPAFRPDRAMNVDDVGAFNLYIKKLEAASSITVTSYQSYLDALKQRHDFFATIGCCVSDHGLEYMHAEDYADEEIIAVFNKIRNGRELSLEERSKFKSAMLYIFAIWDHEKSWVQQYHLGALRNNNKRMLELYGPDGGFDSIGDFSHSKPLSKFLSRLDSTNQLAKTILYNLNPADNELIATMAGNFNDSTPGKIQFGSAWWFLDQKDGMTKQMNTLSNMGLISRFVGMITDSRSFLSYPRHEYFRRLLCNLLGEEIENGELPLDLQWTGKIVRDICYYNAKNYFGW
jgi:glucuronate isomerase